MVRSCDVATISPSQCTDDCVAVLLNLNTLQGWLNAHPGSVKEINVSRYHMHICMDVLDVQNVCTSRICVCVCV